MRLATIGFMGVSVSNCVISIARSQTELNVNMAGKSPSSKKALHLTISTNRQQVISLSQAVGRVCPLYYYNAGLFVLLATL